MASLTPITGSLGTDRAGHLLRRATFGPTKADIDQFAAMDINTALDTLLDTSLALPNPPIDPKTGSDWLPKPEIDVNSDDRVLFDYFKAWFLELMRTTGNNMREKMVFFLHSHMPADHSLILNTTSLYYQNELYRQYAFGNFRELFAKVCVDNAMTYYIDNTLNDKDEPNENFAREMFELYSIGKGDQIGPEDYTFYTETDVKEAARVLTGFNHDFEFTKLDDDGYNGAITGLPRAKVNLTGIEATRHDSGTKTFSAKFNNTTVAPNPAMMSNGYVTEEGVFDELNQMLDMIFAQDATAKFLCRKIYRFFAYYKLTPEVETDIIDQLAATFRNNNYELAPVIRQLLASEHFFDLDNISSTTEDKIGALIKSPVDLVVGTFRLFNVEMPTVVDTLYNSAYSGGVLEYLKNQGMRFYQPIDVAGYPPYHQVPAFNRNWITPNWLARRYEFGQLIIDGHENSANELIFKLDSVAYVDNPANVTDPSNARSLLLDLTSAMLTQTIPTERFDYFLNTVFLDSQLESHWTDEWSNFKTSGDDTTVRSLLDRLFIGLMQSPEYQLF